MDCIALTDHNCAANLRAFDVACEEAGMSRLYGMEISTAEDVHVLALFDDLDRALAFGGQVATRRLPVPNDPDRFGDQPVVNEREEVEYFEPMLLSAATDWSFFDLVPSILHAGALCIPSHVDRPMFGAIEHLGFLPDLPYDAVEVVGPVPESIPRNLPVVRFSDAHAPWQIGRRRTFVDVESFTVKELRRSFRTGRIRTSTPVG